MKFINKQIVARLGIISLYLIPGAMAFGAGTNAAPLASNVDELIDNVLCPVAGVMFKVLITVSIIMVIIAAYKYLIASGDPERIKSANKTITYAAIGVAVAFIAAGFPSLLASIFGSASTFTVCS